MKGKREPLFEWDSITSVLSFSLEGKRDMSFKQDGEILELSVSMSVKAFNLKLPTVRSFSMFAVEIEAWLV